VEWIWVINIRWWIVVSTICCIHTKRSEISERFFYGLSPAKHFIILMKDSLTISPLLVFSPAKIRAVLAGENTSKGGRRRGGRT
jgi:hypothetical protein